MAVSVAPHRARSDPEGQGAPGEAGGSGEMVVGVLMKSSGPNSISIGREGVGEADRRGESSGPDRGG